MPVPAEHIQEETVSEEEQGNGAHGHGEKIRIGWSK